MNEAVSNGITRGDEVLYWRTMFDPACPDLSQARSAPRVQKAGINKRKKPAVKGSAGPRMSMIQQLRRMWSLPPARHSTGVGRTACQIHMIRMR
jgi:hypothetical protein